MSDTIDSKRNNCTLVAVREVSRLPDDQILAAFRRFGYRDHKGFNSYGYISACGALGLQITQIDRRSLSIEGRAEYVFRKRPYSFGEGDEDEDRIEARNPNTRITLGMFCRQRKEGVFLVQVSGHLLVVRGGQIVDHNMYGRLARRRVRSAWLVHNPAGSGRRVTLRRGEDPVIRFRAIATAARRMSGASFNRYFEAKGMAFFEGDKKTSAIKFSTLQERLRAAGHSEPYNRADLVYDIRVGNVTIED